MPWPQEASSHLRLMRGDVARCVDTWHRLFMYGLSMSRGGYIVLKRMVVHTPVHLTQTHSLTHMHVVTRSPRSPQRQAPSSFGSQRRA